MQSVIDVQKLAKRYRLGVIGATTLRESLGRWWCHLRGREEMLEEIAVDHPVIAPNDLQAGPQKSTLWALQDVSLSVRQGEIVGIIGKNGAGKSTLLKILSRITEPTSGKAVIRGRVSSLLEVGTGFHEELTGRENIYLNGAILGMRKSEIDRKFAEIVDFSGVERFIDTPVKRYSSGMYVRLAFAVAAHLEPEILLVDEVLAVGDAAFQKKSLEKMGDVAKRGRTVLFVSHNMPAIVNLCQRAILLEAGRVVKDARPEEVVQHYLSTVRSVGGEAAWPEPSCAPGNDIVRLCAVRILQDKADQPTADVDISKEICIQIDYWNLQQGEQQGQEREGPLYVAIWLKDKVGNPVFSSANTPSLNLTNDPWYGRAHPRGLFRTVCLIPPNFLNNGLYSVTVILGKVPNIMVMQDYVVSFQVHDTGKMRREFLGAWPGVVRPRLAWKTDCISRGDNSL